MTAASAATLPPSVTDLRRRLPADFAFGTATAAYQIEGAVAADGRSPSIWDAYCERPGAILGGDTGETTCDHYHRYAADADLLGWLGARFYRFSISWPRVLPEGSGRIEQRGLDFYRRLLDALDRNGVEPWVTLYHWDLPQVLQERDGGWAARSTAEAFAEFALVVHDALGDRIAHWTTLNEPFCSAFYGYAAGTQAPGVVDGPSAIAAGHHLMLGHGLALRAMRERRPDHRFGVTLNLSPVEAATAAAADQDAARRIDARRNRFFLDPILRGSYPADMVAELPQVDWEHLVRPGDLATIAQPLDLLGVNYYRRFVARAADPSGASAASASPAADTLVDAEAPAAAEPTPHVGCEDVEFVATGRPRTQMGWEIDPEGLTELLLRLHRDYPVPPLYLTENGMAHADEVGADGRVADPERIAYLRTHLEACADAIDRGVDLRGYFAWSFLDNFEWSLGLERRFGLVHVDYETQQRTPKDSAYWYRDLVAAETPRLRGTANRTEVLGAEHVRRSTAGVDPLAAPLQDLVTTACWGTVWERPELPRPTRSLVTVSLLAALGHHDELAVHVRGALRNGCTPEQIAEAVTHTAVYAGAPAALAAMRVVVATVREASPQDGP
ncbi:GH1 family beta-glucosidase [Nocardioides fonticola]|uniref:beta-glucosidase n=2 Tax=Nocardioides fonticola TaxID=450363 RepID=A0ABP7XDZ9_9ACTN